MADIKICEMTGVREYAEGYPVILCREESGRLVVRAYNEARHNCTEIDLLDLLAWAQANKQLLV